MEKLEKITLIATVVGVVLQVLIYGGALALAVFVIHHFIVKFW